MTEIITFRPDKPGKKMFLFVLVRNLQYVMVESTDLETAYKLAKEQNRGKVVLYEGMVTQIIKQ
jgi:hypothetical protein